MLKKQSSQNLQARFVVNINLPRRLRHYFVFSLVAWQPGQNQQCCLKKTKFGHWHTGWFFFIVDSHSRSQTRGHPKMKKITAVDTKVDCIFVFFPCRRCAAVPDCKAKCSHGKNQSTVAQRAQSRLCKGWLLFFASTAVARIAKRSSHPKNARKKNL